MNNRTLDQIFYDAEDSDFFLGSSQYDAISKHLFMLDQGAVNPLDEFQAAIDDPTETKERLLEYLTKTYNDFSEFQGLTFQEVNKMDLEFINDYLWSSNPKEVDIENFFKLKEELSDEPFKFPVRPHLTKIALLETTEFHKNRSWDLWSWLATLGPEMFIEPQGFHHNSIVEANTLYAIMQIFDIDHDLIKKFFGGFDT